MATNAMTKTQANTTGKAKTVTTDRVHLSRPSFTAGNTYAEIMLLADVFPLWPESKANKSAGYVAVRERAGAPALLVSPDLKVYGAKITDRGKAQSLYAAGVPVDTNRCRKAANALNVAEVAAFRWDVTGGSDEAHGLMLTAYKVISNGKGEISKPKALLETLSDTDKFGSPFEACDAARDEGKAAANAANKAPSKPASKRETVTPAQAVVAGLDALVDSVLNGTPMPEADLKAITDRVTLLHKAIAEMERKNKESLKAAS